VSYAGLKVGHNLLEQRQSYLQSLLENEQVKLELSRILQNNLLAVNVKLHEMSRAGSLPELSHALTGVKSLREEIKDVLRVVESGGEKQINYFVNFGNEEVVSRDLNYINYARDYINLEVLELRAKLVELDEVVVDFTHVVENKINIFKFRDSLSIARVERKVGNYLKGIEPFFLRILENSYRLHFESEQEMARIRQINVDFNRTYRQIENTSTAIVIIFILLMGWVVLRSSKKIIMERQLYQQELQNTNENLEQIVQKRTSALKKEISERKSAESQVKKHADFLRHIIESLAHPFYVVDAENYAIVLANSAAMEGAEKKQTTCYALTHHRQTPCDGLEHPCPLQKIKETRAPVKVEHIHRNHRDEEIYVEVHGYPVFDTNGNLVQMIEYSLDITDKKNAENSLKQANDRLEEKVRERTGELEEQILQRKQAQLSLIKSERHYRSLIENISDVITIIDKQGIVSYTSPSTLTVLGLSPENFIGHNIREFVHDEDLTHSSIQTIYERYGTTHPFEYRIATGKGQYLFLESIIRKFQPGDNTDGFILSSRDITVRKQVEEETQKLKMVIEQLPSSVVMTDIEGIIEYVNPSFERITGYSFIEALGKNPRILRSGRTPEIVFKQLWTTIKSGKIWRGEFVNKKKNGELYDENVLIIPIKNSEDEITHFVAVKENITELKKARRQAESANQAKSNFLSRMSHELRTPLNAINGFSQLMLKSKKNPLNDKQKGMTEKIYSAGKHLLLLINEVLDLARIESGELSLSIEVIDPLVAVDDCISLTQPLAQEKQIRVISDYAGKELPDLRADLTRMKQVLLNLLSNAVKYNNQNGTVSIDVKTDIPGFLRFVVEDNGIGIPADKQRDIFTPFVRAVENPDTIEGTGIGMAITKQLVELMSGEIGFESQSGKGSSFWFTLPVSIEDSQPREHVVAVESRDVAHTAEECKIQKEVLYIEDNPVNVDFMHDFFVELGNLRLVVATTGEEGVSMALTRVPELILLDINLPDIDGFQVYQQLKENLRTEFIPVVVVSADATKKTLKRVQKMGFEGYLPKPIDTELLHKTIIDVLEKKHEY
ncbi:MAG: PAS domain S-box protein, partial [Thermodesulfobacteriota bacterium]|nr:PAS domain S-box protein [Thermodesulfobacteriota bacterium]